MESKGPRVFWAVAQLASEAGVAYKGWNQSSGDWWLAETERNFASQIIQKCRSTTKEDVESLPQYDPCMVFLPTLIP